MFNRSAAEIAPSLPKGVTIVPAYDRSDLIGADKRNRQWFFWRGIFKEPTLSQRMAAAGFTRRPSAKSLPSDE